MTITTVACASEPVILDAERAGLAQECMFEIDELIRILLIKIAADDLNLEIPDSLLLRSIGVRIQDLSFVAMSVLGDDLETTSRLKARVWGVLASA